MPRQRRICILGLPHHIVQRGNNRQATFYHHDDFAIYRDFLAKAAAENSVRVHAYVLMTNHVHLLLTPATPDGLSLTMQALGRCYVRYINQTYRRTGTLWEGRFKCSVIDSDHYCLACYRYIELNPVRAGMAARPDDYRWSSYRYNGLGVSDALVTPHSTYLQLGSTPAARTARYRSLVGEAVAADTLSEIRFGSRKGLPVGSDRFKADIEAHLGRRLGTGRVGRPDRR